MNSIVHFYNFVGKLTCAISKLYNLVMSNYQITTKDQSLATGKIHLPSVLRRYAFVSLLPVFCITCRLCMG